jgi:Na+/H+ antiporter NhaD/arsenite permease-like protein
MDTVLSFVLTLVIIFVVPVLIYSIFVKFAGLKEPDKKLSFMISVLVQKMGTVLGFVLIYSLGRDSFDGSWLTYGLVWATMFAIVEIGQAIGPDYSKKEAVAGIISEFIYFPISAFVISQLLV